GATSIVASCDDTHTGPLPTVAVPSTAVFHCFTAAPGAAFITRRVSVPFSGMVALDADDTPGGFHSGRMVIGALKPSLRCTRIFRFIDPFCTSGAFGSTMVILNGASSATANAVRSWK